MPEIFIAPNTNRSEVVDTSAYSFANTESIRRLHRSLKNYSVTPLVELKTFARDKNVAAVFVKDESKRFGLKAFKGLGSVWAIYKVISHELKLDNPTLDEIFQRRDELSEMTFATTTDGNHGKGVSWAAGLFGCKSRVFMPRGTVEVRAQAIRDAGTAEVEITDMTYDDCVKFTAQLAAKNRWQLIQDTAWDGYEEIPAQIMLGYSTLAYEAIEQMNHLSALEQKNTDGTNAAITSSCPNDQSRRLGQALRLPTHIFLQAGVGSMAAAVAAVFAEKFPDNPPRVTIVEPTEVACFYESFKVGDGIGHSATGNGQTMMAGLNCATPCSVAWKILRRLATDAATISDSVAAEAMRVLSTQGIVSGESGCAGFALLNAAVDSPELRRALDIDERSRIFVINTEGDTDPVNYVKVLHEDASK